ncbi:MAG: dephospho-CoA kinase [Eubacteriaceae bacterium]|jgi:dephospho-CoA kinase|nr:dephospho-CoA kinase [Eubacteriaceae bacterium]
MLFVGVTGGIATGKSLVTDMLKSGHGFAALDADKIGKEVSQRPEVVGEIQSKLGEDFVHAGQVDRKALGGKIFSDKAARALLEGILHPLIGEEVEKKRKELEKQGARAAFYDCPLLFEKGLESAVDKVLLVYSDEKTQIERMAKNRGMDIEDARSRLAAQDPIDSKVSKSDYVLYNDSGIEELREGVALFVELLMEGAEP